MNEAGDIRKTTFKIGAFIVKPDRNLLQMGSKSYSLEPRIMDVLCVFAAKPRAVIARQTFIDLVWKVEYGADESLTRAISVLRKTFKAAGAKEDFIQTIPKRGYRLALDVFDVSVAPKAAEEFSELEQPTPTPQGDSVPIPEDTVHLQKTEPSNNNVPHRPQRSKIINFILLAVGLLTIFAVQHWVFPKDKIGNSLAVHEYGRSVAVLSFADMSPGGDQDYFSGGLAEELLSGLATIPDLRVIGRTSSFAFKGKQMDLREIGNTLNVSHLIDGSVRKDGNQIRVSMQLINVSDGAQIWSKTYNGTLDNVFDLQEKITNNVLSELTLLLGLSLGPSIDIDLN